MDNDKTPGNDVLQNNCVKFWEFLKERLFTSTQVFFGWWKKGDYKINQENS